VDTKHHEITGNVDRLVPSKSLFLSLSHTVDLLTKSH
jgi:hypothetical protein